MGIRKVIGKMGVLARSGADKVSEGAKSTFTKENASKTYNTVKEVGGEFVHGIDRTREKALNYSERVNTNANNSWIAGTGKLNKPAQSFLFNKPVKKKRRRNKTGRTIIVTVNNESKRRRKNKKRQPQFGPHAIPY